MKTSQSPLQHLTLVQGGKPAQRSVATRKKRESGSGKAKKLIRLEGWNKRLENLFGRQSL